MSTQSSIKVGAKAPDFTLPNTEGEEVTLDGYKGKHNVVLLFFPLAFSSVCTRELCTIRDNMKMYESMDAEILGISVDSFFTLKEFKKSHNFNFMLLSDFNKDVSRMYGALYDTFHGMKGVSKRSAFVIAADGTLKYVEVLENAGQLPDFNAIQTILDKLNG